MSQKSRNAKKRELSKPPSTVGDLLQEVSPNVLDQISQKERTELFQQPLSEIYGEVSITQQSFSGPLPHPVILEEYNKILPGAADRIISMAENQSEHRRSLESKVITQQLAESKNGQKFGFLLGLAGISGATFVGIFGHWAAAVAIAAGALGTLTASFVVGKSQQKRDLESKA